MMNKKFLIKLQLHLINLRSFWKQQLRRKKKDLFLRVIVEENLKDIENSLVKLEKEVKKFKGK